MNTRKIFEWIRHYILICIFLSYAAAAIYPTSTTTDTALKKRNNVNTTKLDGTNFNRSALSLITASTTTATSFKAKNLNLDSSILVNTRRNVERNDLMGLCPNMIHYIFEAAPHDGAEAGVFEEFEISEENLDGVKVTVADQREASNEIDMRSCLTSCCEKARNGTCNVVFAYKRKCYHVRCVSNMACLPRQRNGVKDRLQMILVNPVRQKTGASEDEYVTWLDVLKDTKAGMEFLAVNELNAENENSLSFWKQSHKYHYPRNQETPSYDDDEFPMTAKRFNQLLMSPVDSVGDDLEFYNTNVDPAIPKFITCNLDMPPIAGHCPKKEECVPVRENSSTGICKCIAGYIRNALRICVSQELDYSLLEETPAASAAHNMLISGDSLENIKEEELITNSPVKPIKLLVTVESKEVRLPETEVALSAYTDPDEETTSMHYKYLWSLITQPKGPMNGTISDQSKSKVKLSNLSEGLYTFKVTVTGDNRTFGEAMANVSVLPESRINRVPQAIIIPPEHTIRLPTTNVILDGSASTDDDKIVGWHWEVVSGPIGYQPILPDVSTLHLTDLTSPGNYTFKLTVTDSDNGTNSTIANITVLKETDYAPVANAGDSVVLYLPNNNVTLNGTASSDDHEIVAWEWTKDPSVEDKAVDMQNTRTPYVQLSNLEQGMYTFVLKVTDSSGQSSTAKVQVCVKPQTNTPPIAIAGTNATMNLPRNWVLLNGSQSHDDVHIQSYRWQQILGPNKAVLIRSNESVVNATSLTLGLYKFQLTVVDDDNNTANDSVWIKIIQEKNAAPVSNAGGDKTITLPISALYLNGSKSFDDLAIVKYSWTRDEASLAAGTIVGNSDKEPVLILTKLSPGHYIFKLTVSDEQGLTNTDYTNIILQPDPLLMKLVEVTLPMPLTKITQGELNSIIQKLGLLLNDMKIHIRDLKDDSRTGSTILVFYVETSDGSGKSESVDGLEIEQLLKDKLQRDASILGTISASDVRTTICQNKCSDHGICNKETRACVCESFWMPSITYYWGIDEANCDWSILYVFVGVLLIFLLLSGICWGIALTCKQAKKPTRSRPKLQKYSLLGTHDEEAPRVCRKSSFTDSETDSDVLFESRSKPNGVRPSNGSLRHKHNFRTHAKSNRKVKT